MMHITCDKTLSNNYQMSCNMPGMRAASVNDAVIATGWLSVRLSVCLVPVFCPEEWRYHGAVVSIVRQSF